MNSYLKPIKGSNQPFKSFLKYKIVVVIVMNQFLKLSRFLSMVQFSTAQRLAPNLLIKNVLHQGHVFAITFFLMALSVRVCACVRAHIHYGSPSFPPQ